MKKNISDKFLDNIIKVVANTEMDKINYKKTLKSLSKHSKDSEALAEKLLKKDKHKNT